MLDATISTASVRRNARELYEEFWHPERFPLWASGLSNGALTRDGTAWRAQGPEGPITITFTEHNSFGVMDHWVEIGDGRVVYVPLRIVANACGSEVMLTLFRQPGMSDEALAADEAAIRRDLAALKAIAEQA